MTETTAQPMQARPITAEGTAFQFQSHQPHRITVEPVDDSVWFPVLAWIHRSGLYPILPPIARDMLEVLLWQRWEQARKQGRKDGRLILSVEELAAYLGERGGSRRSVFRATAFLLEPPASVLAITGSPARLLARHGTTVWEPLPGRSFAARGQRADSVPPPPQSSVPECHRWHSSPGPSATHGTKVPPLALARAASKESHARIQNSELESIDDDASRSGQGNKAIEAMIAGPGAEGHRGFREHDARAIIAATGASEIDVRNAIANANAMLRWGKLKSWTGYVRKQLENGVTLFKSIETARDTRLRVEDKVRRCASAFGDEESCLLVTRWFAAAGENELRDVVASRQWRGRDEELWGLVLQRATRHADTQPAASPA